ncbi:MAG: TatD family hydrolase [Bacteroidetes bacterium]|jgi:TatD DNase family protein|nr:TatD family hydrolase [Bacteroidota bacterium]
MKFVDSHTHLYLDHFAEDRFSVIEKAIHQGVNYMLLPAIDRSTFESMSKLASDFPENCLPMMGLHPTSVDDQVASELAFVESELDSGKYIAVGEIGVDLYWDKTFAEKQTEAFRHQLRLAKKHHLPVVIHTRDSFNEVYSVVIEEKEELLTGVFHCFTGSFEEAEKIIGLGFKLGIGGVLTFKNAGLQQVVARLPLEAMILETDSPYLTPTPFRGKRNESSYIPLIAQKLAELKGKPLQEIAEITTYNAKKLFKLK